MITFESNLPPEQARVVEHAARNVLTKRDGEWRVRVTRSDSEPHWEIDISGPARVSFPFIWPGSAEDEIGRIEQSIKQNVGRALGEEVTAI